MVEKIRQERKIYIDVLRALAAIGVIFIHVSSNNWYGNIGSFDWLVFSIYIGIFRVSVPVFFMISGCLFLNSEKEKSIKELFVHSIFRLLIFLVFWSAIYKYVEYYQNGLSIKGNVKNIFWEILTGNTQVHLWFVYAIIGLYLLVPLLRACVWHVERKTLLYIIFLCIILGGIWEFTAQFETLQIVTNNLSKIKSGFSVGYIGYFLLGAYLDRYDIKIKQRYAIYVVGVIGLIGTVILVIWDSILSQVPSERFWIYTMPGMYLASTAVFVAAKYKNFKGGGGILEKIVMSISEKSQGIYGVHCLIILCLWRIGIDTALFYSILAVPIIVLIVLIVSFILSVLIGKIPVLGKYLA